MKAKWFPEVLQIQRHNQALIADPAEAIHGLVTPVFPSNGNFMIIDVSEAGVSPEALVEALQRQGALSALQQRHCRRLTSR